MFKKLGKLADKKRDVSKINLTEMFALFEPWLSFPQEFIQNCRERIFTVFNTFHLFLFQVLSPEQTCSATVREALKSLFIGSDKTASTNTAAYCKARIRLPVLWIKAILSCFLKRIENETGDMFLWHGKCVKIVDGRRSRCPTRKKIRKYFRSLQVRNPAAASR